MINKEWKMVSLGLILILLSIITEIGILPLSTEESPFPAVLAWGLTILSKVASSIGLALLIGCVTAKISRDDNIILDMDENDKKTIIKKIVSKNNGLDTYKEFAVDKLYDLEDKYFADYKIEGLIKSTNEQVVGIMVEDYYECCRSAADGRISLYFDNEEDQVDKIIIYNPDDLSQFQVFDDIKNDKNNAVGGTYEYEWYIEIPDRFRNLQSLKIHREYTAYGQDHWIQVGHAFSRPTKGVSINMQYASDMVVKECSIVDTNSVFTIHINETLRNYSVETQKWVSEWNGMSLLVSIAKHNDNDSTV